MVLMFVSFQFKGHGLAISRTQLPARRATTATSVAGRCCWNCKIRIACDENGTPEENGAFGKSDIEGKAARVAARERGTRTSFKRAGANEPKLSEFRSDPFFPGLPRREFDSKSRWKCHSLAGMTLGRR